MNLLIIRNVSFLIIITISILGITNLYSQNQKYSDKRELIKLNDGWRFI